MNTTKEKLAELNTLWGAYLEANSGEIALEFDYRGCDEEALVPLITKALVFWQFVRDEINSKVGFNWETREDFFDQFLNDENEFISIVARIESFPTKVWRAVLHKGNIDFQSPESFLRRLEENEKNIIFDTYWELYSLEEVPVVLRKLWHFSGKIGFAEIFKERFSWTGRYESNFKILHNLLSLDFGPPKYPATNVDKVGKEMKLFQFLSGTNHRKDFVVDELGKYFAMYKLARSNYVFFPDRNISLKSHICPGFWWTLIVHLVFWVISPAIFVTFVQNFLSSSFVWSFEKVIFIPGLLTPLWVLAASLKMLFFGLVAVIESAISEKVKAFWRRNKDMFMNNLGSIAFLFAGYGIFLLFKFLAGADGGAVAVILAYLWIFVLEDLDCSRKTRLVLTTLFLMPAVIFEGFQIATIHGGEILAFLVYLSGQIMNVIIPWIGKIILGIGHFIMVAVKWCVLALALMLKEIILAVSLYWVLILLPVITIAFFYVQVFLVPERLQERIGYFFEKFVLLICILMTLVFFGLGFLEIFSKSNLYDWVELFLAMAIFAIMFFVCYKVAIKKNPATKFYASYAGEFGKKSAISQGLIYGSPFFLDENAREKRLEKMREIHCLLWRVSFSQEKYFKVACNVVIPFMTDELFKKLSAEIEKIQRFVLDYDEDVFARALKRIIKGGKSVEQVISEVKAEADLQKRKSKERKASWKKIVRPFAVVDLALKFLWALIVNVFIEIKNFFVKVWEHVVTVKKLWEMFNELCPFVLEKKEVPFKLKHKEV